MGCTVSKELENPIFNSSDAPNAFLSKSDLALQMEHSLQSAQRRYMAVFCTNYGSLRKAGLVNATARKQLLTGRKDSEEDYPATVSQLPTGRDPAGKDLSSYSKAKAQESRTLQKLISEEGGGATKAIQGFVGEPEVINTWELMDGLEDDDSQDETSSNSGAAKSSLTSASSHANDSALGLSSLSISRDDVDLPQSPFSLQDSFTDDVVAAATPPHLTSIVTFDDIAATKCNPPSQKNSRTSNNPLRNPDLLHKTLARKFGFERSSSEDFGFSRRPGCFSSSDKANSGRISSTRVSLELRRRLSEGRESPSSRSSSEFSFRKSQLSFQDWLFDSRPPKHSDVFQSAVRRSLFREFEDSLSPARQGPRHPNGQATTYDMNPEHFCSKIRKNYAGSTDQLAENTLEGSWSFREAGSVSEKWERRPMFDAEFLESFEKAMEQLTEEGWYAGRKEENASEIRISKNHEENSLNTNSDSNAMQNCNTEVRYESGDHKTSCHCRGGKFLVCPVCQGRRLVILEGQPSSCCKCSGTGLIKCSNCHS